MSTETAPDVTDVHELRTDELVPHPDNIRSSIDGNVLKELVASVKARGILQPLLVRPVWIDADDDDGTPYEQLDHYQVIAGHRRLEAAKKVGLDTVPVVVRELDDDDAYEAMLIENLQRVDLSVADEVRGYFRLVERGMSQKELAKRIGRSQKHVSVRMKLLNLPSEVLDTVGATLGLGAAEEWADAFAGKEWADLQARADAGDEVVVEWRDQLFARLADSNGYAQPRPHQLAQFVAQLREHDVKEKVREKAAAKGFELVEQEYKNAGYGWPAGHAELTDLAIAPKDHRGEPCHAIGLKIASGYSRLAKPQAVELCTRRSRHGKSGPSQVKPSDLSQREAQRQREKEEREARKAKDRERLAMIGRTVKGAKKAELVDLVATAACQLAVQSNDDTVKQLLVVLGVETEAKSALDRSALLAGYAAESAANRLRLAAAFQLQGWYSSHTDTVGLGEARDAITEPFLSDEQAAEREEAQKRVAAAEAEYERRREELRAEREAEQDTEDVQPEGEEE